ncbi:MAG: hypothetical protein SWK76_09880 [Actinomycetota bacterium]|nr:hypothetical protein [Actinomycetota bacterium]
MRNRWTITKESSGDTEKGEGARQYTHRLVQGRGWKPLFAICYCRPGCCGALESVQIARILQVEDPPSIAVSSGYCARVDRDPCNGCGACLKACSFEAIAMDGEDKAVSSGLCVDKCRQDAVSLVRDERKGVPLDIDELTLRLG